MKGNISNLQIGIIMEHMVVDSFMVRDFIENDHF